MPSYTPPLRDMQFVMHELLKVTEALQACPKHALTREQERAQDFGQAFIDLARSVYVENDERAAIKKRINTRLGSRIVEEKSYQDYRR